MKIFFTELFAWFSSFSDLFFLKSVLHDFGLSILSYLRQLFPYVILGSLIGEALKFTSWTKLVYRFSKQHTVPAIISATILGILSPLCTYGTVPVLIALYHGGVSVAPLISFLAASAMMNPQLFVQTVGGLGWEIALWRLLLVFIFSLLCGFLTLPLPEKFVIRKKIARDAAAEEEIENRPKKVFTVKAYLLAVGKNLLFVGRMMLIGIVIAAFVDQMPLGLMFGGFDTQSAGGVIAAAIAGVPMYACGGGVIPSVASLMSQGILSRGSALAFLTVGPATRVTSLAAIWTVFRTGFLLLYVLVLFVFSVIAGILLV